MSTGPVDTKQPGQYAVGMTTLDNKTLEWIINNLNYDHEYDRGPSHQTMCFRKGGEEHSFTYFFADDIREWLADLMHNPYMTFLPKSSLRSKDEMPTHIKAICSCGEWEDTVELNISEERPYEGFERELEKLAHSHVKEATEAILARFQWE